MKKIYLILAIISILTTASIFLPAITKSVTVDTETMEYVYYGYDVTFGKSNIPDATGDTYGASVTTSIPFSIFAFLAYFLPLIVLIVEVLSKKNNQTALVILSLSFLISAILLVIITSITNIKIVVDSGNYYDIQKISFSRLKFRFSYSTIIGGIISLIGCILAGFKGIEKKGDEAK